MDGLDDGMIEIVLSEIRRHFKEFYHAPKPKEYPDFYREMLGAYGPSLRDLMYMRRGPIGRIPPLRGEEARKAWEVVEIDYDSMEGYVSRVSDVFKELYGGMTKEFSYIWVDEAHTLIGDELKSKMPRVERTSLKLGAGKNPFAEHTIRSMKGRRK